MKRGWYLLEIFLLINLSGIALSQEVILRQVEETLRKEKGGVFDFGHLLAPDKVKELQQKVAQHQTQGLNVYFVLLPPSTPKEDVNAMAEAVYRDLQMSSQDLLIVFNGKRIYGKTLALKGEASAFQQALEEARPAFKLDYAKGLAQFAQFLVEQIRLRQAREVAEKQIAMNRRRFLGLALLGVLLLALGAIFYPKIRQQVITRKAYKERLLQAERLFDKVTLKMPENAPQDLTAEYLRLDRKLNRLRRSRGTLEEIDQLIPRLRDLDKQLPEKTEQPSILSMLEEEEEQG